MSSANKAKGTRWEREVVDHLAVAHDVTRLPRTGTKDEGDIEVRLKDCRLILEAKNHKSFALSDWISQAQVESDHREARTGIATAGAVAIKRRNHGVGDGYVVMTIDDFFTLLRMVGAA